MTASALRLCAICSAIFTGNTSSKRQEINNVKDFRELVRDEASNTFTMDAISLAKGVEGGCYICSQLSDRLRVKTEMPPHMKDLDFTEIDQREHRYRVHSLDDESFRVIIEYWTSLISFVQFELFALSDKKVSELQLQTNLSTNTRAAHALQQASYWIEDCYQHHQNCRVPNVGVTMPTRLVHVQRNHSGIGAHLCESESVNPNAGYFTLSHCWGDKEFVTLTKQNYEQFCKAIPVTDLPRTFQDAFHVVASLPWPYIWIDSLCIIQNDDEDWRHESARMADVYKGAVCNISAPDAESSSDGFLLEQRRVDPTPATVCAAWGDSPPSLRRYNQRSFLVFEGSPWYALWRGSLFTRAWVLQEQILAPRALHFTANQIYWECKQTLANEVWRRGWIETPLERGFNDSIRLLPFWQFSIEDVPTSERSPYNIWMKIVENYTSRKLTYFSDRLPAISGIADAFCRAWNASYLSGPYLCGLWYRDLPRGLLWGNRIRQAATTLIDGKPPAPSWSWASLNLSVTWYYPSCFERRSGDGPDMSVLCQVDWVQESRALRITGKLMRFRTSDCEDVTTDNVNRIITPYRSIVETNGYTLIIDLDQWFVEETIPHEEHEAYHKFPSRAFYFLERVYFMPLIRPRKRQRSLRDEPSTGALGLVIAPEYGRRNLDKGVFRRVGIAYMHQTADDHVGDDQPSESGEGGNQEDFDEDKNSVGDDRIEIDDAKAVCFDEAVAFWQKDIEKENFMEHVGQGDYSVLII